MNVLGSIAYAMDAFERETGAQPKVLCISWNLVEQLLSECVMTKPVHPSPSEPTKHEICGLPAYTLIEPNVIKCSL